MPLKVYVRMGHESIKDKRFFHTSQFEIFEQNFGYERIFKRVSKFVLRLVFNESVFNEILSKAETVFGIYLSLEINR